MSCLASTCSGRSSENQLGSGHNVRIAVDFSHPCSGFEDEHLVELAAGFPDAPHGRD